jgi:ABC-type multidrug transport system fused ATPase/permease subunit
MGGLLTNYIPILTANFFTILGSMIIPLCYDWQLGLLSLFITPLIAISAYLSMIFVGGYND